MIHQYKFGGYNIVLDVFSGSVHVVDDLAYDVIALYENTPENQLIDALLKKYDGKDITREDVSECYKQVKKLASEKKLFAPDGFKDSAGKLKEKSAGIVKALCLHVAHVCNLNCSYCFASQGKYHGERGIMSYEVGKRALDFLVENSGTRRNLEVDFFGGEPLLNFDVVKKLV
ncbi:MAG: 4Fe-4S cluster-binding domain-containing protein, partial [Clostridia bacterium]|nr:4Fe-4S cluster-binding domain-containing protein [Clostridia bacterium]